MASKPTCYTIGGVLVKYPCKAYPAQLALMDKVIRSVQREQNCLLESPTGSGKTLALLCSSLAWQQAEFAKLRNEVRIHHDTVASADRESTVACSGCESTVTVSSSSSSVNRNPPWGHDAGHQQTEKDVNDAVVTASANVKGIVDKDAAAEDAARGRKPQIGFYDDDGDDFKPLKRQRFSSSTAMTVKKGSILEKYLKEKSKDDLFPSMCVGLGVNGNLNPAIGCQQPAAKEPPKKWVPKIFYGTRTHKQINQIIRELRRTAYKDVKAEAFINQLKKAEGMCVLASRETTCIHDTIAYEAGKNEACKNLLGTAHLPGGGCGYHFGASRYQSHGSLVNDGLSSAWDIEDLVKLGRQKGACPYYVIGNIKNSAQIIFCPYNHLIDPQVRAKMGIHLRDNIVILDEAHNIEDVGREAASFTVTDEELSDTLKNLQIVGEIVAEQHREVNIFLELSTMISSLRGWLMLNSNNLSDDSINQSSLVITGVEAVAALDDIGLGNEKLKEFSTFVESVLKFVEDTATIMSTDHDEELIISAKKTRSVAAKTLNVLQGLAMIFFNFYRCNQRFVDDYRVTILKTLSTNNFKAPSDQFVNRHSASWVLSLNFWCLNPAVSFVDIKDNVRSIVLTSGTLSPMDSFQSELDAPFPIKLETNHVVDKSQVWVGAIGSGPSAVQLQATYVNTETFAFQDEIGNVVLRVCQTVPHGVLLFVSSYYLVEKFQKRWQDTGAWEEISKRKRIFCEERGSNKAKFDEILTEFYEVVTTGISVVKDKFRRTSMGTTHAVGGALLIAVFRGKVSEGLDFSDNFARAVITCGIPYPSVKDIQVSLKRRYNDTRTQSHGLLSGHKWYEIQAFRAVNQALGRCIRHRNDWGALILIDSRFSHSTMYTNNLSKWIRGNLQRYTDFDCAMDSLKEFISLQKKIAELQTLSAKQDEGENEFKPNTDTTWSDSVGEDSRGQMADKVYGDRDEPLDRRRSLWKRRSKLNPVTPRPLTEYFVDFKE